MGRWADAAAGTLQVHFYGKADFKRKLFTKVSGLMIRIAYSGKNAEKIRRNRRMKQVKKMILGFLALAMMVSFAACTNNNTDGGQTANEPSKSFGEMAEELSGEIEAATME
mgnify:CR=1 FL=1